MSWKDNINRLVLVTVQEEARRKEQEIQETQRKYALKAQKEADLLKSELKRILNSDAEPTGRGCIVDGFHFAIADSTQKTLSNGKQYELCLIVRYGDEGRWCGFDTAEEFARLLSRLGYYPGMDPSKLEM